jgi:hypothetical protein
MILQKEVMLMRQLLLKSEIDPLASVEEVELDRIQGVIDFFLPIGCYSIVFDVRRKLARTLTRIDININTL